jgi:hypothetical protein
MSLSTSEQVPAEAERKDRGVLCAKCEHLNAWGRNECKRCGAHLYITCTDCGQRNERVRTRCANCTRRLHHSIFDRIGRRISKGAMQFTGLQVVIFCIGVAFALAVIIVLSQLDIEFF